MPGIIKNTLFSVDVVSRHLNFVVQRNDQVEIQKILEIVDRTGGEIFFDRAAFNSLSKKTVKLISVLNRHFVPEEVLINAVVNWAVELAGGKETCRKILDAYGFMDCLRWGLMSDNHIDKYSFLFSPDERQMLANWSTGIIDYIPFANMCTMNRGLGNAKGAGLLMLTKPPLEIEQSFRNDSSSDITLQFNQFKLCERLYNYTQGGIRLRPEAIYVEFYSSLGIISSGVIRSKPGHSAVYEADDDISGFVSAGGTVSIKLVLNTVGSFDTVDAAECVGFKMITVTPGIIKSIHGLDLTLY